MRQITDGAKKSFSAVLTEGFLTSQLVHKQKTEILHLRQSKKVIRKRIYESQPEVAKLKSVIRVAEVKSANTKQQLQILNDDLVKQLSDDLKDAADIKRVMDPKFLTPESLDPHQIVDIKPYTDQLEKTEKECKVVSDSKLDVVPHAKELFDKLHQMDELILSDLRKSEIEFAASLKHMEDQANKFEIELKHWSSKENIEYLTEESLRRLLGQSSLAEEEAYLKTHGLETIVKKSFDDYIGKEFVAELVRPRNQTLYPTKLESLQVRHSTTRSAKVTKPQPNKMKETLKKISKESDEALSSLQAKLNSDSLIKTYNQLGHVDNVLSKHTKILEFLIAPDGRENTETYMGELKGGKDIPAKISLYEQNVHLTNALRTTIEQYTKNSFSGLAKRVDMLEKKYSE
ncbi:uncharacterized protein EV154DRAFT_598768 [Mucor mucedo]|uniref:uncharacterized protein n=1 Tax=Mucor mucedo TaxID=29922 RepID=UPI00222094EB|nr:uncharacterized protein EV154DRAFT_598768 [Mucor mucedo]KAI7896165.1 hypothetical protein EV154DRAFT_598768 [Mucor mucedo]